jgi:hypothetical protein
VAFRGGSGGCGVAGRCGGVAGYFTCRPAPVPGAFVGESDGAQGEQQGQGVQEFAFHKTVFIVVFDGKRMPDVT